MFVSFLLFIDIFVINDVGIDELYYILYLDKDLQFVGYF